MVDFTKLERWIADHPEEAAEPFMNVTSQRTVSLQGIFEELKREKETGVAIVDEDLVETIRQLDDWLEEV